MKQLEKGRSQSSVKSGNVPLHSNAKSIVTSILSLKHSSSSTDNQLTPEDFLLEEHCGNEYQCSRHLPGTFTISQNAATMLA
jgi:hypothetical protein